MQVTETRSEGLSREFKVAIPASDIEARINSRLKELAQTIRLPGFRPGRVPVTLLRKRFGPAVMGEVLEKAVNESSSSVLTERGLRPAQQPEIEVIAFDDGVDLEFRMALEVLPEIEPMDFGEIALERLVAEPDETTVTTTLERLSENFKDSRPVDPPRAAQLGDNVLIDFVGKIDGEAFAGGAAENYALELGSGSFIPGFEDQVVGAEAGEQRAVVVEFPEDYGAEHLAGKEATFDVTVREVRESAPAAIDDDLAKKFGLEDLAALKRSIADDQSQEFKQVSRLRLKRALLDVLADQHDFTVPEKMVEREFKSIAAQLKGKSEAPGHDHDRDNDHDHGTDHQSEHDEDHDHTDDHENGPDEDRADDLVAGLTEEERAEYSKLADRRVRLGLLLAEVGRRNNLQVGQEDINRAIVAEARRHPGQEREVMEYLRQSPETAEALAAPIFEDKVVDFILEMARITERTVPIEALMQDPDSEGDETSEAAEPSAAEADTKDRGTAAE